MARRFLGVILIAFVLISCEQNLVYSDFRAIQDGEWASSTPINFEFSELDSVQPHHMFIHVRNDNAYEYSNLFLITELEFPDGNTMKDTLEYNMARPTGEWLGKGLGSIKENKLWYKENIVFKDSGVYKVSVTHAMRKNGEVAGLSVLDGVTDVGLQIEKITQ